MPSKSDRMMPIPWAASHQIMMLTQAAVITINETVQVDAYIWLYIIGSVSHAKQCSDFILLHKTLSLWNELINYCALQMYTVHAVWTCMTQKKGLLDVQLQINHMQLDILCFPSLPHYSLIPFLVITWPPSMLIMLLNVTTHQQDMLINQIQIWMKVYGLCPWCPYSYKVSKYHSDSTLMATY